ncbi:MAG: LysR family transcriptional regulator [Pseudomonadota bacterium]
MELKQLERFLAVVEHGTLAGAARALGLTQQALSKSLSGLEGELEVRLFERAPGGTTRLTEYGSTLVNHAHAQLAADKRARLTLRGLRDAQSGVVTIGIGETFAADILATAVSQFYAERPRVRINLVEGYSEIILRRLYNGELDFACVGVGGYELAAGFSAQTIYSAYDVIACSAKHPLAEKSALSLRDLIGYTWVVPYSRPSDTDVIIDAFNAAGLPPPDQFIGSDAYRIGMKLMAQNDFVTMTSPALVNNDLARHRYAITTLDLNAPTVHRHACLVTSTDRPMTPAAKALLEQVHKTSQSFEAPSPA